MDKQKITSCALRSCALPPKGVRTYTYTALSYRLPPFNKDIPVTYSEAYGDVRESRKGGNKQKVANTLGQRAPGSTVRYYPLRGYRLSVEGGSYSTDNPPSTREELPTSQTKKLKQILNFIMHPPSPYGASILPFGENNGGSGKNGVHTSPLTNPNPKGVRHYMSGVSKKGKRDDTSPKGGTPLRGVRQTSPVALSQHPAIANRNFVTVRTPVMHPPSPYGASILPFGENNGGSGKNKVHTSPDALTSSGLRAWRVSGAWNRQRGGKAGLFNVSVSGTQSNGLQHTEKKKAWLNYNWFYSKNANKNMGTFKTSYSKITEIKLISIGLASANRIRQWAEKTLPSGKVVGEVINAETLHYKTFKPIKGGLFCERIFGPTKDHECACGKKFYIKNYLKSSDNDNLTKLPLSYEPSPSTNPNRNPDGGYLAFGVTKGRMGVRTCEGVGASILPEGSVTPMGVTENNIELRALNKNLQKRYFCRVCDVEYTYSTIRRTQLGFIKLATPVTHVWFVKGVPSYMSILLDMKKKDLQQVIYNYGTLTLENALKGKQLISVKPADLYAKWAKVAKEGSVTPMGVTKKSPSPDTPVGGYGLRAEGSVTPMAPSYLSPKGLVRVKGMIGNTVTKSYALTGSHPHSALSYPNPREGKGVRVSKRAWQDKYLIYKQNRLLYYTKKSPKKSSPTDQIKMDLNILSRCKQNKNKLFNKKLLQKRVGWYKILQNLLKKQLRAANPDRGYGISKPKGYYKLNNQFSLWEIHSKKSNFASLLFPQITKTITLFSTKRLSVYLAALYSPRRQGNPHGGYGLSCVPNPFGVTKGRRGEKCILAPQLLVTNPFGDKLDTLCRGLGVIKTNILQPVTPMAPSYLSPKGLVRVTENSLELLFGFSKSNLFWIRKKLFDLEYIFLDTKKFLFAKALPLPLYVLLRPSAYRFFPVYPDSVLLPHLNPLNQPTPSHGNRTEYGNSPVIIPDTPIPHEGIAMPRGYGLRALALNLLYSSVEKAWQLFYKLCLISSKNNKSFKSLNFLKFGFQYKKNFKTNILKSFAFKKEALSYRMLYPRRQGNPYGGYGLEVHTTPYGGWNSNGKNIVKVFEKQTDNLALILLLNLKINFIYTFITFKIKNNPKKKMYNFKKQISITNTRVCKKSKGYVKEAVSKWTGKIKKRVNIYVLNKIKGSVNPIGFTFGSREQSSKPLLHRGIVDNMGELGCLFPTISIRTGKLQNLKVFMLCSALGAKIHTIVNPIGFTEPFDHLKLFNNQESKKANFTQKSWLAALQALQPELVRAEGLVFSVTPMGVTEPSGMHGVHTTPVGSVNPIGFTKARNSLLTPTGYELLTPMGVTGWRIVERSKEKKLYKLYSSLRKKFHYLERSLLTLLQGKELSGRAQGSVNPIGFSSFLLFSPSGRILAPPPSHVLTPGRGLVKGLGKLRALYPSPDTPPALSSRIPYNPMGYGLRAYGSWRPALKGAASVGALSTLQMSSGFIKKYLLDFLLLKSRKNFYAYNKTLYKYSKNLVGSKLFTKPSNMHGVHTSPVGAGRVRETFDNINITIQSSSLLFSPTPSPLTNPNRNPDGFNHRGYLAFGVTKGRRGLEPNSPKTSSSSRLFAVTLTPRGGLLGAIGVTEPSGMLTPKAPVSLRVRVKDGLVQNPFKIHALKIFKNNLFPWLINNLYCLSHRYVWEEDQENSWRRLTLYFYPPKSFNIKVIPLYKNRNYDELFNFDSIENIIFSSSNHKRLIFNNQQVLQNAISGTQLSTILPKGENTSPSGAWRAAGMNINTTFSGAGMIQKLLNEYNFNELKKIDKQNRILLFEFNKHVKILKKIMDPRSLKSRAEYYKACHVRDVSIRRTKAVRKIFNKATPATFETNGLNMILTVLPVLPPDLRPIVKTDGKQATADLNTFYKNIIYRNERLKKFLKDPALNSSFEMKYAQRLVQEAVDNLIQNGKGGITPLKDARGRLLKSLSDALKGKQGRFRQYLLGKRVDYSARSVIVVGPRLKLHECGIPKEIALALYFPFLIKRILNQKYALTVPGAKGLIQKKSPLIWQLLREIMKTIPVLLNRAPTLHRLGFQAFQPKLVEGKAILLHPLVCPAFNADFDGDQMAVHVPITHEAKTEAWKLMLARNNLLSPATGEPLILPSQDMVLGCYYLTTNCAEKFTNFKRGTGFYFHNIHEVLKAYNLQLIDLHALIWVNLNAIMHPPSHYGASILPFGENNGGSGKNGVHTSSYGAWTLNSANQEQPLEIRIQIFKYKIPPNPPSPDTPTGYGEAFGSKPTPRYCPNPREGVGVIREGLYPYGVAGVKQQNVFKEGIISSALSRHSFLPALRAGVSGISATRTERPYNTNLSLFNYKALILYSKLHQVLDFKLSVLKPPGILTQCVRTTPGKILFNTIIQNALNKRPILLNKKVSRYPQRLPDPPYT